MAGHIKSIVPQRGGVAPVDNNTVALFLFDKDAKDNIKGVKPIGNQSSLFFNGLSETKISCGSDIATSPTQALTIEAWIRLSSHSSSALRFIAGKGTTGGKGFWLGFFNDGTLGFAHQNQLKSVKTFPTNTWIHVAGVWDGTNQHLYVNGVLENSVATTSTIDYGGISEFRIGDIAGAGSQTERLFNGSISEVRLHKIALSANEIKLAMNQTLVSDDNLVGYWKLDETEGSIAYDYSQKGNDGVISGATPNEGLAVYSLIKDTPRDGGVLIEEGTTNLINVEPTGWTKDNGATVILTEESYEGQPVYKVTLPTGSLPRIWKSFTSTGQVFSGYLYARIAPESVNSATGFYFRQTGFGTSYSSKVCSLTSEWQKFSLVNITCAADFMFMLYQANATTPDTIFYMTMPQLEEKTFSTSFTSGIRSVSRLQYPLHIINPSEYTISCWVKFNRVTPGGAHQTIIEVGEAPGGTTYRFLMFVENNQIGVLNANDVSQSVAYGMTGVEANRWYYLVASFDGTNLKFYVDGELKVSEVSVTPLFKETALVGIGGPNWNSLNGIVDEVRVDKIARTSQEIQSWYYQGRNGW